MVDMCYFQKNIFKNLKKKKKKRENSETKQKICIESWDYVWSALKVGPDVQK